LNGILHDIILFHAHFILLLPNPMLKQVATQDIKNVVKHHKPTEVQQIYNELKLLENEGVSFKLARDEDHNMT